MCSVVCVLWCGVYACGVCVCMHSVWCVCGCVCGGVVVYWRHRTELYTRMICASCIHDVLIGIYILCVFKSQILTKWKKPCVHVAWVYKCIHILE